MRSTPSTRFARCAKDGRAGIPQKKRYDELTKIILMQPTEIPNGFYRVSIKGLILDESRRKFAVILEDTGWWELPGGGMDWGESPEACLKREIREEMGLTVTEVSALPSYYLTGKNLKDHWTLNLVFEVEVKDLNFTPSEECRELRFISPEEINSIHAFRTVKELAAMFKAS
jgi:8-oxo-dGTP diphosphatase